ncbi:MAG: hypothetical protein R3335_09835, partial [Anaerolineales bacterium]|nr:hypothetical protein [Anaerolineales bacterium]
MSRRPILTLVIAGVLLSAGCGRYLRAEPVQDDAPFFVPPPVSEARSTEAPTSPPAPAAVQQAVQAPPTSQLEATSTPQIDIFAEDPFLPRSRYELKAELDYEAHRVEVEQKLTYVNRASVPLNELVLIVEPQRRAGAFRLEEIRWLDGTAVEDYSLEDGKLVIPLPAPLPSWKS